MTFYDEFYFGLFSSRDTILCSAFTKLADANRALIPAKVGPLMPLPTELR
jgi:hypothetical protein